MEYLIGLLYLDTGGGYRLLAFLVRHIDYLHVARSVAIHTTFQLESIIMAV